MTREQPDFLRAACEAIGTPCEVRPGYSGRGMYGETTFGVVVPSHAAAVRAVFLPARAGRARRAAAGGSRPGALRQDRMGRDQVILY